MAFRDIRLDTAISYGAVGGPTFRTVIATVESGAESRDATLAKELGSWDVAYAARFPAIYKPLQAFFRIVRGRADTWRFNDCADFEVITGQGVFTTLTATTFQMWKRYTFGAFTYDCKIVLPVSGTVGVTGGVAPTIDYTTGIVTVASGTPTAWTGQFDRLCRFDTDQMRASSFSRSGGQLIIGWEGIPIKEVVE